MSKGRKKCIDSLMTMYQTVLGGFQISNGSELKMKMSLWNSENDPIMEHTDYIIF